MSNNITCPDCASDAFLCKLHQRARIEYEQITDMDMDRTNDPVYLALLRKYSETDPYMD